ncbi:hypothetical protein [Rhodobacter maris]|uniref:hypothetical protein n=1 Tax=Rhodobacter maris TaxID=446682 RepID=UPI0011440BF4|nr:hypothetical protein [Rhodobacter maris]
MANLHATALSQLLPHAILEGVQEVNFAVLISRRQKNMLNIIQGSANYLAHTQAPPKDYAFSNYEK